MVSRAGQRARLATTSFESTGSPSWNLSPGRRRNVQVSAVGRDVLALDHLALRLQACRRRRRACPTPARQALRTTYWVFQIGSKLARSACGTKRSARAAARCEIAGVANRAGRGQDAGTGYRLQECSSIHKCTSGQATGETRDRPGRSRGCAATHPCGSAPAHRGGHATLPTPQKNGSGPLTTPLTFLRHAW